MAIGPLKANPQMTFAEQQALMVQSYSEQPHIPHTQTNPGTSTSTTPYTPHPAYTGQLSGKSTQTQQSLKTEATQQYTKFTDTEEEYLCAN
jgi:hypothetical protein